MKCCGYGPRESNFYAKNIFISSSLQNKFYIKEVKCIEPSTSVRVPWRNALKQAGLNNNCIFEQLKPRLRIEDKKMEEGPVQ
jgi:hypothetical protein